ncbi:MAG: hypothetical protein LQ351_007119 [Letrouitia transgressa]|nr:MAG: hypothetical protein LQ351_007119 [Letrouitia transgressa]
MSSTVVHVKNIAHQTSEQEVRDFFSFCGKITSLSVTPASSDSNSSQSATVTFEKETAAKTALLLDNTQLGSSQVQVSSAAGLDDLAGKQQPGEESKSDDNDISQEDKPRSRIFAEYLAHGYTISDAAIQRAIALDNKHGVSNRFTSALQNFDSKYKATDRAKGIDASYGISEKASRGWAGIHSYFEKAIGTPTGQKLAAFYTQGDKQVRDIHAEARRLADLKAGKSGSKEENAKTLETVPGTERTTCQCGGNTGVCPCQEGKCACSGCTKSGLTGEKTATGPADEVAASTSVQPLAQLSLKPVAVMSTSIRSIIPVRHAPIWVSTSYPYVCLRCRHQVSLLPLTSPIARPLSSTSGRPINDGIEKVEISPRQNWWRKKIFGEEEAAKHTQFVIEGEEKAPKRPEIRKREIDDPDYKPASTWHGLESIGGPTGWWEKEWDQDHQFFG